MGAYMKVNACATRETPADFLRPLLRAEQDAYNVDDLAGDLVDHDIRKRRKYEFARPLFLARTPAIWKRQQRGGAVVNSAHQSSGSLRHVLKYVIVMCSRSAAASSVRRSSIFMGGTAFRSATFRGAPPLPHGSALRLGRFAPSLFRPQ